MKSMSLVEAIAQEYDRAAKLFGPFKNGHEGYAVIKEELDELWDAVKVDDVNKARKEALHVAAMALRFMIDIRGIPEKHNLTFDELDSEEAQDG